MEQEFDDLLPMFVAEARQRVERLTDLLADAARDDAALAAARRELHTIKGAARMLQLTPIAELCHHAEEKLVTPHAGVVRELSPLVDRLSRLLDDAVPAATGVASAADALAPADDTSETLRARVAPTELRVATDIVDALADRATRLRILALGAGQLVDRLHHLARLAQEGAGEKDASQVLAVLAATLRVLGVEFEAGQRRLERTAEAHLDSLLELQVQPLKGVLQSLARHAREMARSLQREVEVELRGEETRLDRRIVREIEEALLHLVRNAVDHGIEPPRERAASGKPRAGLLRIEAEAHGARVRIVVADDGPGIDTDAVVAAAHARGLVDAETARTMSREQTLHLLFTPGFTTRSEISELSGRGVGLDVVTAAVSRLGGQVRIESEAGRGTVFALEVPATRRGEVLLLLRVGQVRVAMPKSAALSFQSLSERDIATRDGRSFALTGDVPVPFVPLAALFGQTPGDPQLLVQASAAGEPVAIAVDAIEGEEEVLVRPLPRLAEAPDMVEGVALLPSGEPIAVLSPLVLAQLALGRATGRITAPPAAEAARQVRVLLVDDSLVTREMERRLLEDAGFEVAVAGDAEEALASLGEEKFDCVVTDVEMPGMSGFELTRRLRGMAHLAHTPVVVVSTRDRPEDRLEGLSAGADAYITKQGLDPGELVKVVRRLGGL